MTEPVLYRHFASKRDLWAACLDAAWEEFREVLDAVLAAALAQPPGTERRIPPSVAGGRRP